MMKTKLALIPLALICTLGSASAATPAPVNWTPGLEPPAQGEYRDPMEMFRIKLPSNLPLEILKTLALELDNIDVTAMVSRNGEYAELTPLQPMPWGTHTLRLVEYATDGSINEKAYWEFEVRRNSAFREVDYAASINLIASQRISEKYPPPVPLAPPEPNEFTGQGSAVLQGRIADDDWEVSGQMDMIYNSVLQPPNKDLDLGSYLVSGRKNDSQFNLGHHALAQNSLIIEGFNRRGLSASTRLDTFNSAATGFVMRPDIVLGFRQGLGLSDSANRVNGVILESQPLKNPEALYMAATYLTGEQTLSGATVGSTINDQQGDAMSLVADSTVMDRRLRVRGEVAASKVSIDYANPLAVDITDENNNAMALLTTWTPFATPGQSFFWNTGIEASQVDTFFASLANPGLPSDKKLNRLFFNTDWAGISAQLSTAIETNNVNKLDALPVIETRVNQALLNYAFNQAIDENSWMNWLGVPSITLQWRGMTQEQVAAAVAPPIPLVDMNMDTDMIQFSNNFSYTTWSWGWLYGESEQIDHVNVLEQLTYSRGLNANFRIGEHISIMPMVQQQTSQFSFDGSESDTRIVSLSGQYLMQDSWNGSLMFNQAQSESGATLDSTTDTMTMQLTWNWILPKNKHPGFDVILSGSWQQLKDAITPANDLDTYQVFLSLAMKLPISSAQ